MELFNHLINNSITKALFKADERSTGYYVLSLIGFSLFIGLVLFGYSYIVEGLANFDLPANLGIKLPLSLGEIILLLFFIVASGIYFYEFENLPKDNLLALLPPLVAGAIVGGIIIDIISHVLFSVVFWLFNFGFFSAWLPISFVVGIFLYWLSMVFIQDERQKYRY